MPTGELYNIQMITPLFRRKPDSDSGKGEDFSFGEAQTDLGGRGVPYEIFFNLGGA